MDEVKLDAYMPFYGAAFFGAPEGYPEYAVSAYIRAIWYYWSHTHCKGIKNDPEFLRTICRVSDRDDWDSIKAMIFGEMFHLNNGVWHQTRARKELFRIEERVQRGRAGAIARWKHPPPPKR